MTQIGVLLGTAAYMSPEQAKGRPADKRSDVWAFGCVFYEMLTGQRAFAEDDISETLAAVLKSEPDWTRLPSDVPQAIRTLIQRCLVKDRRQRVADISAAKFVLCELGNLGTRPATANVAAAPRSRWQRVLPPLAAAVVTAAIVGAGMWMLRPIPRAPLAAQFTFGVPPGEGLTATGRQLVAISRRRRADRLCGQFEAVSPPDRRPGRSSDSWHRRHYSRRPESAVFAGWSVDRIFLRR